MVAYSYKKRFAVPVALGLGLDLNPEELPWLKGLPIAAGEAIKPKRQTVRADRKRHARPGEELQHYCGMRTKGCFLIGRARCVSVKPIFMRIYDDADLLIEIEQKTLTEAEAEIFAAADGFGSIEDMWLFWRKEHVGVVDFTGVVIGWEPLP